MTRLALSIAGIRIDVGVTGPRPAALARYAAFGGDGDPAWTLALEAAVFGGRVPPGRAFVASGGRWGLAGDPGAAWLDVGSRTGAAQRDAECLLLDALLRAAVARSALDAGGLLLHASAVVVDGRAHVFPAPSGSGKSTLAAGASHPLSDEVTVLLPGPGGFVAHATPWWTSRGGAAPVACVYELAWDGEEVTPLPRSALRRLVTNLALPLDGPEEQRAALSVAAQIARSVPCARLAFRPDTRIDALLRGRPGG